MPESAAVRAGTSARRLTRCLKMPCAAGSMFVWFGRWIGSEEVSRGCFAGGGHVGLGDGFAAGRHDLGDGIALGARAFSGGNNLMYGRVPRFGRGGVFLGYTYPRPGVCYQYPEYYNPEVGCYGLEPIG
jgi:hypothetical protein